MVKVKRRHAALRTQWAFKQPFRKSGAQRSGPSGCRENQGPSHQILYKGKVSLRKKFFPQKGQSTPRRISIRTSPSQKIEARRRPTFRGCGRRSISILRRPGTSRLAKPVSEASTSAQFLPGSFSFYRPCKASPRKASLFSPELEVSYPGSLGIADHLRLLYGFHQVTFLTCGTHYESVRTGGSLYCRGGRIDTVKHC